MIKSKQKSWLFWLLQFAGWGFLAFTNAWAVLIMKPNFDKRYVVLKALLFLFSGIFATSLIRNYLKQQISFKNLSANEFKKLGIALFFGVTIFVLLLLLDLPLYGYFIDKNEKFTNLQLFSTILNAFIFVFFWMLIYISVKMLHRLRKDRLERLELEKTLKESQLNTLKGQINPHFMFNSLNNIRGLMLEDVEKSREMITRLSEMLRYSLIKSNLDVISLSEELENVENYIELSKIQLENRLQFDKKIDIELLEIKIPPMLIQMLLENAVKHGISNLNNGGKIVLQIKKNKANLEILVQNDGKLILDKTSTKVGLKNIKKRLKLMYNGKASFSLTEKDNMVFALIRIPLNAMLNSHSLNTIQSIYNQ